MQVWVKDSQAHFGLIQQTSEYVFVVEWKCAETAALVAVLEKTRLSMR
jgi:hypothetical protein